MATNLGERYDEIAERMDAAYAARRGLRYGSPEFAEADAALEAVYVDLRALNAVVAAR
jgi:hypothetical protein